MKKVSIPALQAGCLAALFLVAACAPTRTPPPAATASATVAAAAAELQTAVLLPAAPKAGTPRYEADRGVFRATRALEGTPRWALAQQDVDYATPRLMDDFSCAMGVPLDASRLPKLAALVDLASQAADASTRPAKKANQRQRPFLIDPGATCQSTAQLSNSFDYPSGHATRGWAVGLVLTELAPDRATDLLLRARAFGDSRVVCGVHNLSAIEAGAMNGAAVVAVLHASPSFQASLADARRELEAYRHANTEGADPQCAAQRALIETTPY
ncbi:phosphatase PAP2 family protein [Dyella jiangningensis]|uniref:acid phosphatase n=1 Tax=Dyella jiangningensis TaxID=1379159 RepID=UPI00240EFCF1|nr:phosphatase PAP2 family protein [Dyella jiangningensis]MDG2538320.1 phosphatase PAP2 family protein [Dyella jiangningensis]